MDPIQNTLIRPVQALLLLNWQDEIRSGNKWPIFSGSLP
jgi:hypothetical protein